MVQYTQTTGIRSTSLGKNEEVNTKYDFVKPSGFHLKQLTSFLFQLCLINLEKEELPLYVSANFLVATPLTPSASEIQNNCLTT